MEWESYSQSGRQAGILVLTRPEGGKGGAPICDTHRHAHTSSVSTSGLNLPILAYSLVSATRMAD